MDRRAFLVQSIAWGSVASLSGLWGCGPVDDWLDERIQSAISGLQLDMSGARLLGSGVDMGGDQAMKIFRGALSIPELYELTSSARELRRYIRTRSDAETRNGELDEIQGWLIPPIERAVIALLLQR